MRALRDARQSERHSCMYKYSADAKSHECNRVLRVAPLQAGRMRLQSGRVNEFNNTLQLSKMHVESERHMAAPLTWESERETAFTDNGDFTSGRPDEFRDGTCPISPLRWH